MVLWFIVCYLAHMKDTIPKVKHLTAKSIVRINVAINFDIHNKVSKYCDERGMKINKVVEFAILDYLTKAK